jgi:hypothetical protein
VRTVAIPEARLLSKFKVSPLFHGYFSLSQPKRLIYVRFPELECDLSESQSC